MAIYVSPRSYAWHYVNDVIAENWIALEDPTPSPSDEEELAACLVEVHNDSIDRIRDGVSLDRHWAIVDEVRLRLRGLLTPDVTLVSWTSLAKLPGRPAALKGEPVPILRRRQPLKP